jgi:hypothetical protein
MQEQGLIFIFDSKKARTLQNVQFVISTKGRNLIYIEIKERFLVALLLEMT